MTGDTVPCSPSPSPPKKLFGPSSLPYPEYYSSMEIPRTFGFSAPRSERMSIACASIIWPLLVNLARAIPYLNEKSLRKVK